ncbi:MAG: hypothetical protein ACOYLH_03005 [Flavobacteriales bacterium]
MLDNLINLVKEHAGEAIINNPAIPNERNDEAVSEASNGIFEGLKNQLSQGGIEGITSLFNSQNASSNPAVANIGKTVATTLAGKFGIDEGTANGIVDKLLPTVMDKLVSKTNDPNDNSFDLGNIVKSIGGDNLGGIGNMIGGLFK